MQTDSYLALKDEQDHYLVAEYADVLVDEMAELRFERVSSNALAGEFKPALIEIGQCGEEQGRIVFLVRDNGIGIASEQHERIFGLFNKLNTGSSGTGIGLALVKRIIEFHGGRVWVESEVGKGSTFYFTLPHG